MPATEPPVEPTGHDPAAPTDADSEGEAGSARSESSGSDRRARVLQGIAMGLAVLPILVAAVRDGLQGWYPSLDAATTVLRTRDVLSANPPLVGMWASVSANTGVATYFPGAIQMYLLAIPVHVLGDSWGTLLGMALLNSAWVLLATWLIGRRLGPQLATFGCLAFAALVWTMGSELVVDISPMQMVTIPFALFLVAVWSVADGDLIAIPFLAGIANYLVLGHLVLTLLVPTIGLVAVVGLVLALRRQRRAHPESWSAVRTRLVRMLGLSVVITALLWLAPIYQQFTDQPGNLTNLWHASQADLHASVTFAKALQAVVSILLIPPFWLRDSFTTETISPDPHVDGVRIVLGLAFVALLVGLTVLAVRRRDRTIVAMVGVAVAAIVMSIINITKAPAAYGFKRQYFRSLWAVSMFVWLTVVVAIIRSIPALRTRTPGGDPRAPQVASRRATWPRLGAVGAGLTLVVAGLAIPHKDPGPGTNGTTDQAFALNKKMIGPSVDALRNQGKVLVVPDGAFTSFSGAAALVLALDSAGVDVCVRASWVDQYGDSRTCGKAGPDVIARVTSTVRPVRPGAHVIVDASALPAAEQHELDELTPQVRAWLETRSHLALTPERRAELVRLFGAKRAAESEARSFRVVDGDLASLVENPTFARLVASMAETRADGTVNMAIDTGTFSPRKLLRWAELTTKADDGYTVRVTEEPSDR